MVCFNTPQAKVSIGSTHREGPALDKVRRPLAAFSAKWDEEKWGFLKALGARSRSHTAPSARIFRVSITDGRGLQTAASTLPRVLHQLKSTLDIPSKYPPVALDSTVLGDKLIPVTNGKGLFLLQHISS
jgi:hypothetical protein